MAQWLVHQGAKHLLLIGRSQPSQEAIADIHHLQQSGITIQIAQADISQREDIERILKPYLERGRRTAAGSRQQAAGENQQPAEQEEPANLSSSTSILRPSSSALALVGIFHLAGLLDDGTVQQQTWERFQRVMAPKVEGAWHLHQLTQHLPLDYFVMFSSAASLIGSAGQANYAAANAFLDALAHHRHAMGLVGLSINWGAWGQVGLAVRHQAHQNLQRQGITPIDPSTGLEILEYLLSQTMAQVGVLPIDWATWIKHHPSSPLLADLHISPAQLDPSQAQTLLHQLANLPDDQRLPHLTAHIRTQLAHVLGLDLATLTDHHQGFSELGLDSLTSIELRNRLQNSLERSLPATLLYDYPTLADLTQYLSNLLLPDAAPASAPSLSPSEPPPPAPLPPHLDHLSDDEAAALLLDELNRLNY